MSEPCPVFIGKFEKVFTFESFGVGIRVESTDSELLEKAETVVRRAFVSNFRFIENDPPAKFSFGLARAEKGKLVLFRDGEYFSRGETELAFFRYFNSMLRIRVAEYAVGKVFLHSGAVGINGTALLIPGNSYSGKSTIVAELIKNGAEYYSDEYAVLDEDGLNHPFPRDVSLRDKVNGKTDVLDFSPASFGGRVGTKAIPVGAVLITEYKSDAVWRPEMLSHGQGILELVPQTISLQNNAEFSLRVLKNSLSRAIIARSPRGDSKRFAKTILSFFEKAIN